MPSHPGYQAPPPDPLTASSGLPGAWPSEPEHRSWYDGLLAGRQYEVVCDGADGYPLIAFNEGQWYDVTQFTPRPISVRAAVRADPAWAGAVVQASCWWMREHPRSERSFELATELALVVGELARVGFR